MKNGIAAKQYASAIYQVSSANGKVEMVLSQMEQLENLLQQSSEMSLFWKHPQIQSNKKLQAVQEVLNMTFLPETTRFLLMILDKGRSQLLDEVLEQFRVLQREEQGVLVVRVSTAQALDVEQEQHLIEKLRKEHEKEIVLEKIILPELIGGVRIQVEDTVYDSTIRRRLDKMREVLLPQFR